MAKGKFNATKRYPVGYRCQHCGADGYLRTEGHPSGNGWNTCPRCRFGALVKMHWNGCAWH